MMVRFFENIKKTCVLRVILLVLLMWGSMAQAGEGITLSDTTFPAALFNQEHIIMPNSDARSKDSISITNWQMLTAKVTVAWRYETTDLSPIYDMATYRIWGGTSVNLPIPRGSRTQTGIATIEISPYKSLVFEVASDGMGSGAQLGITVQSIEYPPTLSVQQADISLHTGVPVVNLQPIVRSIFDTATSPAITFTIEPALPAGLSMNTDGVITGTPTTAQPSTNYVVTATRGGATTAEEITITIANSVVASWDAGNVQVRLGGPMSPVRPVLGESGTQALTYSVSPALPSGLTMAAATGTITGIPALLSAGINYTVTVTDGVTQASKDFTLAVLPPADAPVATPDSVTWQAGVDSEVTFAVRSDIIPDEITPKNSRYGSLKLAGGPELWGTAGYPDYSGDSTSVSGNGVKFRWANPIPGTYAGEVYFYDGDYVVYTIPFTLTVSGAKSDQTLSFTSAAPAAIAGGATYNPVATATSGLVVNFSIDSASAQVCQIAAGQVSFLQDGACIINADQSGDSATNPAPRVQQVVEVATGQLGTELQTISFTSPAPTPVLGGANYTPTITASSGLPVVLFGDTASKSVCWPSGTEVFFFAAGSCTVHAEQAGNIQYARAESSQTFIVATAVTATQVIASKTVSAVTPITPFTPVIGANGIGPLTYTVSPTLPEGISWSTSNGEVSGTPEAPSAEVTYTVTVSDTNASTSTATFKLSVTNGPAATLAVASKGLTVNTVEAGFTPVIGSGGTGVLAYTIMPALPDNLTMSPSSGEISGIPSAISPAIDYTVTVTDANNRTGTATFSLVVNEGVIATQVVASPRVTQGFLAIGFTPVTGSGGTAALSYSVSPNLPAGLSMNSATGQITGAPTVSSSAATFTVTVTDDNSATATANFSLIVDGAVSATQAVATKAVTAGSSIAPFSPVTGAGGRSPLSYSVAPDLPSGLALAPNTGIISGTPSAISSATTYTVTVTDGNTATATATLNLTINGAVVATQAVARKTLSANVEVTAFTPIFGTGGTGTLVYTVSPDLPAGLLMDEETGAISGKAEAGATEAAYSVTVTDSSLATDIGTFNLTVEGPVDATTAIVSTEVPINTAVTPFAPVTGTGGTGDLVYSVSPQLPTGLAMAPETGIITGTPNTSTAATTYTVTVTDENSTTATAEFSLSVTTIASSIILSTSNTSPQPGETVTLTATVTPSQATGLVTFKDAGSALGGPVSLLSGVATFSTAYLGNGVHVLTAEYEGSSTHQGSTSNSLAISLLSPSSEFTQGSDEIRRIVHDVAVSKINTQVDTSVDVVRSAIRRMSDNTASASNIVVSSMNSPLEFQGDLNAANGTLNADANFFGQRSSADGAKRRLVYGTIGVNGTDSGTTSAFLSARVAWEWSTSERAMLGYWLGLDAGRSDIRSSFFGVQTSLGLSAGLYGIGQVGESIFVSGFASLGQDKNFLELENSILALTSDYMSQNQVIGTALTASIKRGRVELRPEFGLSYGQINIGNVNFTGSAFGQTDDALSFEMGEVSVATVSFVPEVIIHSLDRQTIITLTPRIECQKVITDSSSYDCGGGGGLSFEHSSPDGLSKYFARVRSEAVSGVMQTGFELILQKQF